MGSKENGLKILPYVLTVKLADMYMGNVVGKLNFRISPLVTGRDSKGTKCGFLVSLPTVKSK